MPTVSTFTSLISQLLPEPHAGLLSGILFGVKQTLDPELKAALIRTGTLHIVALSGMNITILTQIIAVSLERCIGRRWASVLVIPLIIGFIWFVGPSPSVIRAGIMGGITLVGTFFGKPVLGLWSWGIAVALMLIVKPLWITDLSFQLSVLASLGMILFGRDEEIRRCKDDKTSRPEDNKTIPFPELKKPQFREWNSKESEQEYANENRQPAVDFLRSTTYNLRSTLSRDLSTTLSAQVFTTPLLFFTFGRLSLISPLTNVLIVWTLPTLTVIGLLLVVCGVLFQPLGQVVAWVCWLFLEYIIRVILWTAKIPGGSIGL